MDARKVRGADSTAGVTVSESSGIGVTIIDHDDHESVIISDWPAFRFDIDAFQHERGADVERRLHPEEQEVVEAMADVLIKRFQTGLNQQPRQLAEALATHPQGWRMRHRFSHVSDLVIETYVESNRNLRLTIFSNTGAALWEHVLLHPQE